MRLGTVVVASEQEVFLNANLLLGHHCAIVGSTGSGKSCTVTALIDSLLDHQIPGGHIVIFDINGEYAQSFAQGTARGKATRSIVLGLILRPAKGLFLPHWFMNNEENLALLKASEGVQAPVLQRSITDARSASSSTQNDLTRLQIVQSVILAINQLFDDKNAQQPARQQLVSVLDLMKKQEQTKSPREAQWKNMLDLTNKAINDASLADQPWQRLTAEQKDVLSKLSINLNKLVTEALGILGMGSSQVTSDFDAPVYYSLQ
ncbi:ATP-binding protein [Corynebacterium belfantii]|uniref:ATP-binding protein n=1 Tax=Corynebacterium belfantii TaxID=2014537 RepID=UPI002E1956E4